MISSRAVLFVLALIAACRGFSTQDEGFSFLEELDQEVKHHLKGLQLLVSDSMEKLPEQHGRELRLAQARVLASTSDIMEVAESKKCPQEVKNELANLGYSFGDRWDNCMNLTEELVALERIGYKLYLNISTSWEPVVCQGANDIALCFKEAVYRQAICFVDVSSKLIEKMINLKDIIEEVFDQVYKVYESALSEFKTCFGSQESNIRSKQLQLIAEECK